MSNFETALKDLKKYAAEHPYDLDTTMKIVNGELPPAGDTPEHVAKVGIYRVVMTLEEHPGGWMWHVSLSTTENTPPDPKGVHRILVELGLNPDESAMYAEKHPRFGSVLNVIGNARDAEGEIIRPESETSRADSPTD